MVNTPTVDTVGTAVAALARWQYDSAPMQLHPGDVDWNYRFGADVTAAALRTWSRDGRILAVGFLDTSSLIRMTVAPDAFRDEELARRLIEDLDSADRGVLPAGAVSVEAPAGLLLHELLTERGWGFGEPWTPLSRDLAKPVREPGVRIETIGPDQAEGFAAVLRSAFASKSTAERWHALAAGPRYGHARCLGVLEERDVVAAVAIVWSAGPGRPGLVEPMGVHQDFRGRGYGRAICLAGAAALREAGATSVRVCTASANVGGVATYQAAGFTAMPEVHDRIRAA